MLLPSRVTLGCPVKSSTLVKRLPHWDCSKIDDVEIFGLGFEVAALRREEMDVRIARVPTPIVHVDPPFQAQLEILLTGCDVDFAREAARIRNRVRHRR